MYTFRGRFSYIHAILLAISPIWICTVNAEPPVIRAPNTKPVEDKSVDYHRLIALLENRNPKPIIRDNGTTRTVVFSKSYDWNEQDRVRGAIQKIVDNADDAFRALTDHLEDKEYCITIEREQSSDNLSIGDVCQIIIADNLTAAYMPLIPDTEEAFHRLCLPDPIPVGNRDLKQWCQNQLKQGKSLVELQIEMCQWVITELPKIDEVNAKERTQASKAILRKVEELRTTKKPELIKRFFLREIRAPYSKERAERMREKSSNCDK